MSKNLLLAIVAYIIANVTLVLQSYIKKKHER